MAWECPPRATNEEANISLIKNLLRSYAFTMATRSYWKLEDVMSSDVVWNVIDHRKSSTPRMLQRRGKVRTELETLYRPYITCHRQNITRTELLHFHRALAVPEFKISVMESSTPGDGYKGRSAVGRYMDELVWTNATQWRVGTRDVEYSRQGECRCDPDVASSPPGCPDSLMGPAMFDGVADRIPLESLYLAYADEEVVPAAGSVPRFWSAASQSTKGNIGVVVSKLNAAGFIPGRQYEYQAQGRMQGWGRNKARILVVLLNPRSNCHGELSLLVL